MSSRTRQGSLFIIAAPSGGGKTSLVNALLKQDPRLVLSISHTTRAARPGEIDGQHYHFVSEAEYEQMVEDGDFMEHARVFDHYYGTNRNSVAHNWSRIAMSFLKSTGRAHARCVCFSGLLSDLYHSPFP